MTQIETIAQYLELANRCAKDAQDARYHVITLTQERDDQKLQVEKVERHTRQEIIDQAKGIKELGPNQAAQQAELERLMALNKVLSAARGKLATAARKVAEAQSDAQFHDDCAKAYRAALYALGGRDD